MKLEPWGWDGDWAAACADAQGLLPGRVLRRDRDEWHVAAADGMRCAALAGRLRHELESAQDLPTVGDWVLLRTDDKDGDSGQIVRVLPRRGVLARQAAGRRAERQVVAANVDLALIVSGLDGGRQVNRKRLERALALCRAGGVAAALVLNKRDLCEEADERATALARELDDIPVVAVSALTGQGLAELRAWLLPGRTVVLLGMSGVGKSALLNALTGEALQTVGAVRATDLRGRHTTTHRELFLLPGGALMIDTPGIRELQMAAEEEDVRAAFGDIDALAADCRFGDCRHDNEPGCAVQAAVARGELDADRVAHCRALRAETRQRGRSAPESRRIGEHRRRVAGGKRYRPFDPGQEEC